MVKLGLGTYQNATVYFLRITENDIQISLKRIDANWRSRTASLYDILNELPGEEGKWDDANFTARIIMSNYHSSRRILGISAGEITYSLQPPALLESINHERQKRIIIRLMCFDKSKQIVQEHARAEKGMAAARDREESYRRAL